jgi:asparagine synthase (glutamine-hydrolysing)
MDQPSTDGVNSWFVSRATRQAVTVSLSGLGSDEIFAGYPHFGWFLQAARIAPRGNRLLLRVGGSLRQPVPRRLSSRLRFVGGSPTERSLQVREVFPPRDKVALMGSFRSRPTELALEQVMHEDSDVIGAVSRSEIRGYLVNTLLRDADAMSMAHSLEVRVPFVDHRVVEFALSLPGRLKLDGSGGKAVLKHAVADLLPADILHRPKSYFSMPLHEWAAGPLLPRIRENLRSASLSGLFDPVALERIGRAAAAGEGAQAWAVAILAGWLETHRVSA